jgi:hypothetical protein
MLAGMPEPERFYVASMKTQVHKEVVYIEYLKGKPDDSTPSVWRITKNPAKAHDFGSLVLAREFQRQLKQDGEARGLKNDGHVWHIRDQV